MKNFLTNKISPILAFLLVLIFGYFSIYLMSSVFENYAKDELITQNNNQFAKD